jgi:hypothetical protein
MCTRRTLGRPRTNVQAPPARPPAAPPRLCCSPALPEPAARSAPPAAPPPPARDRTARRWRRPPRASRRTGRLHGRRPDSGPPPGTGGPAPRTEPAAARAPQRPVTHTAVNSHSGVCNVQRSQPTCVMSRILSGAVPQPPVQRHTSSHTCRCGTADEAPRSAACRLAALTQSGRLAAGEVTRRGRACGSRPHAKSRNAGQATSSRPHQLLKHYAICPPA